MSSSCGPTGKPGAAVVLKYILLPAVIALLAAGAGTYVAYQGAFSPEDSVRMESEAEESVRQMETALDGSPQGWQRLMQAAQRLYRLGRFATPPLLRIASSKKADSMIRKMAIEIVRDIQDPRAIGPFASIARDTANPPGVRYDAASSLGYMDTPDVIDSLLAFLASEDDVLIDAALTGIRASHSNPSVQRAFEPVLQIVENATNADLREAAVLALGAFGDRAVASLTTLLQSPDDEVRIKAMYALSGTESRNAVKPLVSMLDNPTQEIRTHAMLALQDLGDTSAVPALAEMLRHGGYDAADAAFALSQMGDRRVLPLLDTLIREYTQEGKDPESFIRARNSIVGRHDTRSQ